MLSPLTPSRPPQPPLLPLVLLSLFALFRPAAANDLSSLKSIKSAFLNSTQLDSWTGPDPCAPTPQWVGVTCTGGRVTGLNLNKTILGSVNRLSGVISPAFGQLDALTLLDLGSNQIGGSIPVEVGNLTNLVLLDLRDNLLTGPIPDALGNLRALNYLDLDGNRQLNGTLPTSLGNLTSLQYFGVVRTSIAGPLPDKILSQWTELEGLNVAGSLLSGPLPTTAWRQLKSVVFMDLSSGHFTGAIPEAIGNMTSLANLLIQNNHDLTGRIPESLGNLLQLRQLWLTNCSLSGLIPPALGQLTKLEYLGLSNNVLNGSVPASLGNLTNLLQLDLSHNLLTGPIPLSLSDFPEIQYLDLATGNNLTGSLQDGYPATCGSSDNPCPSVSPHPTTVAQRTTASATIVASKTPAPTAPVSGSSGFKLLGLPVVAIAGIGGGALLGLIGLWLLLVCWCRHRRNARRKESTASTIASDAPKIVVPIPPPSFPADPPAAAQSSGSSSTATSGAYGALSSAATASSRTGSRPSEPWAGVSMLQSLHGRPRLFTVEELSNATDGFSDDSMIGRGGFGPVYKGSIEGLGLVAIKVAGTPTSGQGRDEFRAEVTLLSCLRHPNLVELHGFASDGDHHALVYRFEAGGNLRELLDGKAPGATPLPWRARMRIAVDSAAGLAYLHRNQVLHRDIKSTNILLTQDLQAKVADFGLSRLLPTDESHVTTGVRGTMGYLCPDYILTQQAGPAVDVYAFGVLLAELLSGKRPVDNTRSSRDRALVPWFRSIVESADGASMIDPNMPGGCPDHVAKDFAFVVSCCLSRTEDRPAMKDVLQRLLYITLLSDQRGQSDLSTTSVVDLSEVRPR